MYTCFGELASVTHPARFSHIHQAEVEAANVGVVPAFGGEAASSDTGSSASKLSSASKIYWSTINTRSSSNRYLEGLL